MLVETLPEKDCTKSSVLKCLTKKDLEEMVKNTDLPKNKKDLRWFEMEKIGKRYIALFSIKSKKVNIYGFEILIGGVDYQPSFVIATFPADLYLLKDE